MDHVTFEGEGWVILKKIYLAKILGPKEFMHDDYGRKKITHMFQ